MYACNQAICDEWCVQVGECVCAFATRNAILYAQHIDAL